jgi:hypothetical protein
MNPHWPRWMFASISKHFKDAFDAASIEVFLEGTNRPTPQFGTFFELRLDGPVFQELNGNEFKARIDINCLYKVSMGESSFHTKHEMCGTALAAFLDAIPLYRFGDGPDDDGLLFACASRIDSGGRAVVVKHFGQIEKDIRVEQGSVSGSYLTYLTST